MAEATREKLTQLKGFTFDGDTGRTLRDLYQTVGDAGYTKDAPFVVPSWREGDDTPVVLNSYLDGGGNRVHVVWQSDSAGLSRVVDIIDDAPSLEKVRAADGDACDACSGVDAFRETMEAMLDE